MEKFWNYILWYIKSIFVISAILSVVIYLVNCSSTEYKIPPKPTIELVPPEVDASDTIYLDCIEHIKACESFSSKRYLDNDGAETIGYGHHIKANEAFPEEITEVFASKLLQKDFEAYLRIAGKYADDYTKQLALGLFMYNVGESKYKASTLKTLVDDNKSIDSEIVKWCHFTHKGEVKTSRGLLRRRRFELSIYNIDG